MPGDANARARRQRLSSALGLVAMSGMLVVSIVLLALSSVTLSPGEDTTQNVGGGQCRDPQYFVALLSVSTIRLGLSVIASAWVFVRRRRSRKAAEAREAILMEEVRRIDAQLHAADGERDELREQIRQAREEVDLQRDAERLRAGEPDVEAEGSTHSLPVPILAPATLDSPPSSRRPSSRGSIYHRSNSSQVSFRTASPRSASPTHSPNPNVFGVSAPQNPYARPHTSVPSLGTLPAGSTISLPSKRFSAGSGSISPAAHLYTFPPAADTRTSLASRVSAARGEGSNSLHPAATSRISLAGGSGVPSPTLEASSSSPAETAASSATPNPLPVSFASGSTHPYPPTSGRTTPVPPAVPTPVPAAPGRPVSRVSAYPDPYVPKAERRKRRNAKWAGYADTAANNLLSGLAIVHFLIWVFGSVLCLTQLPTVTRNSCYAGAPLLWWGLMVTTIVFGWLHALYYASICIGAFAIIVTSVVYLIIAYFMGWPVHPIVRGRPNTPAPEKLSDEDLKACPIVAYLPDPSEPLPEPSVYEVSIAGSIHESVKSNSKSRASRLLRKTMGRKAQKDNAESSTPAEPEPQGEPVQPGEVDPSRLDGLTGIVLSAHQATCAICQSSFLPPREVPGKAMYNVQRLRQLPCKHVFHQECVDQWLTGHSASCPYCNQSVKDMLHGEACPVHGRDGCPDVEDDDATEGEGAGAAAEGSGSGREAAASGYGESDSRHSEDSEDKEDKIGAAVEHVEDVEASSSRQQSDASSSSSTARGKGTEDR